MRALKKKQPRRHADSPFTLPRRMQSLDNPAITLSPARPPFEKQNKGGGLVMLSPAKINHALQINSHSKGQGENKASAYGRSAPKALWLELINVKPGNFRVLIKILSRQEVNGKDLIRKKTQLWVSSYIHT